MSPRLEPLKPCRMIELTSDQPSSEPPRIGGASHARYEPADQDRISSEVVVWTPAVPARARSLPDTRVNVECIELGSRLDPRLTLLSAPDSPQAKAFRMLRHKLNKHADPRVIAVTSAERGEGKTTCAVNLALALAEETLTRVLLFEANVRQPALARLFGFEPRECLSVQMGRLHGPTRGYHIAAVAGTRLCIAAMSPDLARGTRLDRFLMTVALSELRSEYDYIVVDTSPALESADTSSVAGCVDGVIIVARANKSKKKNVRATVEQIGQAPLLGIALLDSREAA
jgi:Mrp family chromosome partitioning ATPase